MKLRVLAATLAALSLTAGVALAQTAAPAKPAAAPAQQLTAPDKATLSYALGYERGNMIARSGADIDPAAVTRGLQDGMAKKDPSISGDKLSNALSYFGQKMEKDARANFEKVARENKVKSDAFMATNKTKPGVITLPSGVQYRVLTAGTGPKPTATGQIVAHMRAVLSVGGPVFDTFTTTPLAPPTLKVSEMGPVGLREAVMLMPSGSRWEIVIPPEKGVGKDAQAPGGPNQVAVYDFQLVNVK